MPSPYLQRPVRSLPQALEEIARERGVPVEDLYRQSGSATPPVAPVDSAAVAVVGKSIRAS
jgi:hypothetical protein